MKWKNKQKKQKQKLEISIQFLWQQGCRNRAALDFLLNIPELALLSGGPTKKLIPDTILRILYMNLDLDTIILRKD